MPILENIIIETNFSKGKKYGHSTNKKMKEKKKISAS